MAQNAQPTKNKNEDTSWENVKSWYSSVVGSKGHYYHQTLILPNALRLLKLKPGSALLDLACGQGVLERAIPQNILYLGLDKSRGLIAEADKNKISNSHAFQVADITQLLAINKNFTHASIILALQNLEGIEKPIQNAATHLQLGGKFLIVINHPYYRIPRHSSWETDEKNNTIYRKTNRYLSLLKIPIAANPGQKDKSAVTLSYHYPFGYISQVLAKNNMAIVSVEEWISDKQSVGKHAKEENIARKEFPLFMAILAVKLVK
jgi:ubiquinone/menaquinone biosynthesis C-methylase UbiE